MASQASTKKILAIGGMVAVIGVVGMIALDYPPAGDDAAGTIVPAKRFRADGGGTTIVGDSAATQTGTNIADGVNAGANKGETQRRPTPAANAGQTQAGTPVQRGRERRPERRRRGRTRRKRRPERRRQQGPRTPVERRSERRCNGRERRP